MALLGLGSSCAAWQTVTRDRQEYELYRQSRVGGDRDTRLRAAWAYLQAGYQGAYREKTAAWFYPAAKSLFRNSRSNLRALEQYLELLPDGPHHAEAYERLLALRSVRARELAREREALRRDQAVLSGLDRARAGRRALSRAFTEWVGLLLELRSWGQPTSDLPSELLFAFRQRQPEAVCEAQVCEKTLSFDYAIPIQGQQVPRQASISVRIGLEKGGVAWAEIGGPQLYSRLFEAMDLDPVDTGDRRIEALAQVSQLVEVLLEAKLPQARCGQPVVSPELLVRRCDGVDVRMVSQTAEGEQDRILFLPVRD